MILRVAIALALVLPSWTRPATSEAGHSRHPYTIPHVLRIPIDDVSTLNPMLDSAAAVGTLARLTMAYLIRTDARGEPVVPELAVAVPTRRNGGISADGKTITYHLRRGVVWSDGIPFTADDVVFSTNLILNPKTNVVSRGGFDRIVKIDEPDRYTVVYHLREPDSAYAFTFFTTAGANAAILPRHLLLGKDVDTDAYNALPVGIGPFVFREWRRGDAIELAANPRYFRGPPKLQRIECRIVANSNTEFVLARAHELDLWTLVNPRYAKEIAAISGIAETTSSSAFYDHLDFNTSHPILAQRAVRLALRDAIDRPTILRKVRLGFYDAGESVVPPSSPFHADIPVSSFDPAAAARRLDAAGWLRGPDSIRVKNGTRLALAYASTSGSPALDEQVEIIRSAWTSLGVDVGVKRYAPVLFFGPKADGGILANGTYDVANFATGVDPNADLSDIFGCDAGRAAPDNATRYCDPAVAAAIARGRSQYEREARIPGMRVIQEAIARDAPTVVIDYRRDITAYNDDLRGFDSRKRNGFDDMLAVDI